MAANRDPGISARAAQPDWSAAYISFRAARLENGLTIVAHHDPKMPVVAVYVAYRAGSRDEPESKAGLAHLCEHLMYTGVSRAEGSYFAPFERAGAVAMNAFVAEDYSAYFETVPIEALDFALSMEAHRMAHLAEALDRRKIDLQREIVRNELREREAGPYGCAARMIAESTHPRGHPYAHPPDGMIDQLDNIDEADVRAWIDARHTAANAAVVIAGDIESEPAVQKARECFEMVRGGSSASAFVVPTGSIGASRAVVESDAECSRLHFGWAAAPFGASDYAAMEVACELLGAARGSPLWRRLAEREALADEIALELRPRQLGSQAILSVTAHRGVSEKAIEAAVFDEVDRLSRGDFDESDLAASRMRLFSAFARASERLGGRGSKSDLLGLATMIGGNPQTHNRHVRAIAAIDRESVSSTARRWLRDGAAIVTIRGVA